MEHLVRIVLATAVGVLVPLLLLASVGFFYSIRPMRYLTDRSPADLGWTFESVSLRTRDGLQLSAWYVPKAGTGPGGRAVIALHGYPFSKADILGVTPYLHEGYDLLLLDFRYFGRSEGSMTTFGHREWQDVVAGVDFLRERGTESIALWGFSFGASVALLALPHTDAIDAVIADTPFSDLGAMARDYYRSLPLANHLLAFLTDLMSRAYVGVSPREVSPLRAAASSTVPLLLIHGDRDSTIPIDHFERMRNALAGRPGTELWVVEGANHGRTYGSAPGVYEERVLGFLARYLQ